MRTRGLPSFRSKDFVAVGILPRLEIGGSNTVTGHLTEKQFNKLGNGSRLKDEH